MPPKVWVSSGREPKRSCPVCFARLDGATCVSLEQPDRRPVMHVGDITMCAYCGVLLVLETPYGFRFAGAADAARLPETLQKVLAHFPAPRRKAQS